MRQAALGKPGAKRGIKATFATIIIYRYFAPNTHPLNSDKILKIWFLSPVEHPILKRSNFFLFASNLRKHWSKVSYFFFPGKV